MDDPVTPTKPTSEARTGRAGPRLPVPTRRPPLFGRRPAGEAPSGGDDEASEPQTITAEGIRWINIPRPRQWHRSWLEERFDFHVLDYEDIYSRNQRPKVDRYDDYLFIVLQFPRFDVEAGRLTVVELDLFIGSDYVVTLPDAELDPLESLFARCQESEEVRHGYFAKGSAYLLYRIVDHSVDASFPMLRKMGQKLERIEDDIFEGRSEQIVRDISNAKQEILNFRRIVRPQRIAFRDLERAMDRFRQPDLDIYFDDVIDASERIWDTLENYKEVIEGLESSNESVLSHRVNDVLRLLTAFSVIVLPLTLIASIFGMNVLFPGEGTALAFWVIVGIMAATLVGMVAVFRSRGWI